MAPRKDKAEKVSQDEAVDTILNYLRKQNRPYSATDVSANLHNKVTKAAAAKILKDLHERKEIEGRASGKQIVYHALQKPEDAITPEALAAIDTTIQTLRDETVALNASARSLKTTLAAMNATLSTTDLRARVAALEAEREDVLRRLTALRSGSVRPVTAEERAAVESEHRRWERIARARKKIWMMVWGLVSESLGERDAIAEVKEQLDISDD